MSIIITVGRAVIGGGDAGVTKVETTTPTTGGGGGATEAMTIEETVAVVVLQPRVCVCVIEK